MIRYEISEEQIDIFVSGPLDSQVLFELFETIGADTEFDCRLTQYWHLQDVDCSNLRSTCLSGLSSALRPEPQKSYPKVCFIAETDLLYGMCRAYAAWLGGKPIEVGVFRTYDAALAWVNPTESAQRA